MSLLAKRGAPLPYRLECRGDPLLQHAIVNCCECENEDAFVYTTSRDKPQNPHFVVLKFQRRGWEFYKSARARCSECRVKQAKRKAHFARKDAEMQTPKISLVKPQTTPVPPELQRAAQVYLVVIDGAGVPSIKSLAGAQEMLFGNQMYLVIPQDAAEE